MEPLTVLIVDDEHYNREELKHLLKSYPVIEVIGEADTGESALTKCIQLQPDVILLDVEMPKMNGMEVARSLLGLKTPPLIIFATAYPQFAVEAFRYEAIDYLLKPYDELQLEQAVLRAANKLRKDKNPDQPKKTGKLAIEDCGEIIYLDLADIYYVNRDEKVTKIITKRKEYETKMSLKELESKLQCFSFYRIHKSTIVNLDYVSGLSPWFNGAYQLGIQEREEALPVSRNYVKGLRARLEI